MAISSATLIAKGLVSAAHDLSDGGLAVALAEMAMAGGIGAIVAAPGADSPAIWFGEDQGRYLLAAAAEKADEILRLAKQAGVPRRGSAKPAATACALAPPRRFWCGNCLKRMKTGCRPIWPAAAKLRNYLSDGLSAHPRSKESPMPMEASEIERMIKAALPDAEIIITDLAGDGDHYRAQVISEAFRGLSRVRQHQLVYAALGGNVGGVLHALALETAPPETTA